MVKFSHIAIWTAEESTPCFSKPSITLLLIIDRDEDLKKYDDITLSRIIINSTQCKNLYIKMLVVADFLFFISDILFLSIEISILYY